MQIQMKKYNAGNVLYSSLKEIGFRLQYHASVRLQYHQVFWDPIGNILHGAPGSQLMLKYK